MSFPPHGIFTMQTWHLLNISVSSSSSETLNLNLELTAVISHFPPPRFIACSGYNNATLCTLHVERGVFSFPSLRFAIHDVGLELIAKKLRHIAYLRDPTHISRSSLVMGAVCELASSDSATNGAFNLYLSALGDSFALATIETAVALKTLDAVALEETVIITFRRSPVSIVVISSISGVS